MVDQDTQRRQRAAQRRVRMLVRKTTLRGQEAGFAVVRGDEAVSLLTRLSRELWALSGREVPRYARHEMPVRFVPRGS